MQDFAGNPVNNAILDQYDKQKSRGRQGFGIYDGDFDNMVHESKEDSILDWLVKYDSSLLLMHHRFPTSTINVKRAAHPFSTKDFFNKSKLKKDKVEYILVHNGTISNADELYNSHWDLGIDYHSVLEDLTFNDSEALLWDFALTMEGKQEKMKAKGAIAFICLKLEGGRLKKMYFARNYSSPLKMIRNKEGISLASELEGGEDIPVDVLHTWNYGLRRLTKREFKVPSRYDYDDTPRETKTYIYGCNCNDVGWTNCNYHGLDDYSYDWENYQWQNRIAEDERKMGEKVGNVLSRQFGDKFKQRQLPIGHKELSDALENETKRRHAERNLIDDPITNEEITKAYYMYLTGCEGHFESAYWAMEGDLLNMGEYPATQTVVREMRLIELCLERISSDPDYVSEVSKTDKWREYA